MKSIRIYYIFALLKGTPTKAKRIKFIEEIVSLLKIQVFSISFKHGKTLSLSYFRPHVAEQSSHLSQNLTRKPRWIDL